MKNKDNVKKFTHVKLRVCNILLSFFRSRSDSFITRKARAIEKVPEI